MASKTEVVFEKFAAFIFLLILVGLIGFLVYIPMPDTSEKVILIIIGGLMSTATGALPRLFGSDDSKEEQLKARIRDVERHLEITEAKFETIKQQYDRVIKMLVDKYVIPDGESKGIEQWQADD